MGFIEVEIFDFKERRVRTMSHKPRTICIVTGSRAEYGLLYWLMREIRDDTDLELQIIATPRINLMASR